MYRRLSALLILCFIALMAPLQALSQTQTADRSAIPPMVWTWPVDDVG